MILSMNILDIMGIRFFGDIFAILYDDSFVKIGKN